MLECASAYQEILGYFKVPTLLEKFGNSPFLFQHDCARVQKAGPIKTWMNEFGVEEVHWPAQSTDPNPTEHLWDELEQDCKPGLLIQYQCLTSQMRLWKNGQKFSWAHSWTLWKIFPEVLKLL